jgi:hypothetical protein
VSLVQAIKKHPLGAFLLDFFHAYNIHGLRSNQQPPNKAGVTFFEAEY